MSNYTKRQRTTYSGTGSRANPIVFTRAKPRKLTARKSIAVVPGFTRRVGNYGRYGGNALRAGLLPEKKFFDTQLDWSFDTTGEVPATGQLNLIPQGDTESTRDGRKCTIESIQIRGRMVYDPAAFADASALTYLYVVLDTQCNGAAAAVTDVFTSANMWENMLNLNNSGRFRIIKKFVHMWQPSAGGDISYNSMHQKFEWYKKCNIPIEFSSTTGAITEIKSNNIFLLAGSVGGDDLVTFDGFCRLRFRG